MTGIMQLMAGGPVKLVSLQGLDPVAVATSPSDASATYALTNTGLEQATGKADGTWLLGGSAGDYDVRATLTSGTLTLGTTGSWLNLGTSRSWNVTRTDDAAGTTTAEMTVEIRLAATGAVLATATVSFSAQVI